MENDITGKVVLNRLAEFIDYEMVMTDEMGTVVASTNEKYIGKTFYGTLKLVVESLNELVVNTDDEYGETPSGVYRPLFSEDYLSGAIGVLGDPKEVVKYGEIAEKSAEILIKEKVYTNIREINRMAKEKFFDEWIFSNLDEVKPDEFARRSRLLGIDVSIPKRIAIMKPEKDSGEFSESERFNMLTKVVRYLKMGLFGYAYELDGSVICLFKECDDELAVSKFTHLAGEIEIGYKCRVKVGIDSNKPKALKLSYENAQIATRFASNSKIVVFDEKNILYFISVFPNVSKIAYLEALFPNQTNGEIIEKIEFLKIFYSLEGSITRISDKLFLHKNSVQYRLNRITEISGFNPRKLSDAYRFSLAVIFYDELIADNAF